MFSQRITWKGIAEALASALPSGGIGTPARPDEIQPASFVLPRLTFRASRGWGSIHAEGRQNENRMQSIRFSFW